MGRNIFSAKSRLGALMIHRSGEPVSLYRPDGTATKNKYGKVTDTDRDYEHVGDDTATRVYEGRDSEPGYGEVTGGRVDTDSPRIALPQSTIAEEGDRVEFPNGHRYELDERIPMHAYVLFRSTLITHA